MFSCVASMLAESISKEIDPEHEDDVYRKLSSPHMNELRPNLAKI